MAAAVEQAAGALERGEFPVGCVLVSRDGIVGSGARIHTSGMKLNELDHAEILALRDWVTGGRMGAVGGITAYVTLEPCFMCLGALMINNINRIIFAYEDVMGGACGTDMSRPLTAGIISMDKHDMNKHIYTRYGDAKITGGVLRRESLSLFYDFFTSNSSDYLRDTYLARYTLEQKRAL